MGAGPASPGETKRFCGQCFSLVGPSGITPTPNSGPLPHTLASPAQLAHQWLTFFEPVQLRGWVLLWHRRGLFFPFLFVLPCGKDILESLLLLLQISC